MRLLDILRRRWPRPPGPRGAEAPVMQAFDHFAGWSAASEAHRGRFDAQYRLQCEVGLAAGGSWPGWCGLCEAPVRFSLPSAASGEAANLREEMVCPGCGLTARNRAAMALLLDGVDPGRARLYLTEQASAAFVWLQARCPDLQGGEFGLDEARRARLQAWFERLGGRGVVVERDVTRLDFAAAALDGIGCYDVLEHVPDYVAALREFARVLLPGGRLVLTAPFVESARETRVRARLRDDGTIEHHDPPEIHGDPVAGGVLCYYHFGWDLLAACRDAGFREARWLRSWSPREGLFGLWTLVARR